VEGRVQKVGYRDAVQGIARKLGVKGYVENLKDGNVQILCEVDEGVLEEFVKRISVKEDFIEVERLQIVEKSEATGEFSYFEIRYGRLEEEFGERMVNAIEYAKATRGDIQHMHKDLKEDLSGLRGEVKDMHTEIKGMHTEIQDMHKDLKGSIEDMHVDLKESIDGMHKDLKGSIQEMHKDLKDGIVGVQSEVRDMHVDMNRSFDDMAKRYDAISSELVRTREELTRAVDGLLKAIEEFIQERRRAERRQ